MAEFAKSAGTAIARYLTGIFLCFLGMQILNAGSTRLEPAPAFTVDHSGVFVIRDSGSGETLCPTLKNLLSGYPQHQLLLLPFAKLARVSENSFCAIAHNVFYVFVSSLAP